MELNDTKPRQQNILKHDRPMEVCGECCLGFERGDGESQVSDMVKPVRGLAFCGKTRLETSLKRGRPAGRHIRVHPIVRL